MVWWPRCCCKLLLGLDGDSIGGVDEWWPHDTISATPTPTMESWSNQGFLHKEAVGLFTLCCGCLRFLAVLGCEIKVLLGRWWVHDALGTVHNHGVVSPAPGRGRLLLLAQQVYEAEV